MSFSALQELTADEMNQRLALLALKSADETVNNSAALQNDNHLFLSVAASTNYEMMLRLIVNSGTTPDIKVDFTYPTGATATFQQQMLEPGSSTAGLQGPYVQTDVLAMGTTGSNQIIFITGLWFISTTAGTLQVRWAQNTATASNSIVRANSYMILRKIG